MSASQRLLQLSDCHLGEYPGERLLGLNTDESLADVLALVRESEDSYDYMLASGDISSEGTESACRRFVTTVREMSAVPLAWLAGNHDSDACLRQLSASGKGAIMDRMETRCWQLLLLNSAVPGHEYGSLAAGELERVRCALSDCQKPTMVFVHHQPVPVGSAWIDQYVIREGQALLSLLAGFPHVKALVWGHVHQEYAGQFAHFQLLSTPSTCIQFKPGSEDFALDCLMPGYRWFELHDSGDFDTGVRRVAEKDYGINFSSGGY